MNNEIKEEGHYELFKTTKGHQILHLNKNDWYALVEGQQGQIIVYSDEDHQKEETLEKGTFYVIDFERDEKFRDIPHLFLGKDEKFKEYILPNGLPTAKDKQKKIVETKEWVSKEKVEVHLKGKPESKSKNLPRGKELASKTKAELQEIAKEKGITGRSKMNKSDLVKHLK